MSENIGMEVAVNRDHYFGACPQCGGSDGYLNVRKSHWFFCDTHRTRWWAGSGLFSSWHDENDGIWASNAERLDDYREIEPLQFTPEPELYDGSDEIEPPNWMTGISQGASAISGAVGPDGGDDSEIPF